MARSQSSYSTARPDPFRLLDLPAELRNLCYRYVTYSPNVQYLRRLKPPAITRVSRQLRSEATPVYFDVNHFTIEITLPYTIGFHTDGPSRFNASFLRETDSRSRKTGTLQLPREIRAFFKGAGPVAARIKNLPTDFVLLGDLKGGDRRGYVTFPLFTVRLSHDMDPVVLRDQLYFASPEDCQEYDDDIDYFGDPVVLSIEAQTTRPGYSGLTIGDVRQLARTVRCEPKNGALKLRKGEWR